MIERTEATSAKPSVVRSFRRGLEILHGLNQNNPSTALELSCAIGLPRSTVYRLLDTLVAEGYVAHGAQHETYQLSIQVRTLGDGFTDEALLVDAVSPILQDLGQKIVWPTDIATFDRDAMVVRETTHTSSPLSITGGTVGFRVPVLLSSLGLAYLAWCSDAERELILRIIGHSNQPDAALARDRPATGPRSTASSNRFCAGVTASAKAACGLRPGVSRCLCFWGSTSSHLYTCTISSPPSAKRK